MHLYFFSLAKKKKPKLLNKFDKTIKTELDAAEKLRKKVSYKILYVVPDAVFTVILLWLMHAMILEYQGIQ